MHIWQQVVSRPIDYIDVGQAVPPERLDSAVVGLYNEYRGSRMNMNYCS